MVYEYCLVFKIACIFDCLIDEHLHGGFSAARIEHGDEFAVIAHMEHGLDAEHCSDYSLCRGNSAAATQMIEVVNSEPVRDMSLCFFGKLCYFLYRFALACLRYAEIYKQCKTKGFAKRIYDDNLAIGIFLGEILCRDSAYIISGRKI